ncbi:TPA: type II secretion system minor pseudopilin GspH [Enterobacter cancerogenus]
MAHQKGFTLLEVMLVMVIIALAAAGVVAMQSDRLSATGKLLRQIEVLRQTANYMSDVALLEKHTVGLQLTDDGWLFYAPEKDRTGVWRWQEIDNNGNLPLRGDWDAPTKPHVFPSSEEAKPQIVILPDGQVTPFSVIFNADDGEKIAILQSNGTLPLEVIRFKEPR